jgi:hypothetical protein
MRDTQRARSGYKPLFIFSKQEKYAKGLMKLKGGCVGRRNLGKQNRKQ